MGLNIEIARAVFKGIELQVLIDRLRKFRDDRNWEEYHTPKNLAMSIAIEAAELMECFQWQEMPTDERWKTRKDVEEETADVFIYLLNFCDVMGIDLIKAASEKIDKNEAKYPVKKRLTKDISLGYTNHESDGVCPICGKKIDGGTHRREQHILEHS